ncbi:uncharacterized protein LOC141854497 [Brevipalpus obovatus]|uniref:uncharacterized protein LOC141854497 n=1 Tax=Brevipalpus obovatus TaxID=246614 RepID=UPI003D9F3A97
MKPDFFLNLCYFSLMCFGRRRKDLESEKNCEYFDSDDVDMISIKFAGSHQNKATNFDDHRTFQRCHDALGKGVHTLSITNIGIMKRFLDFTDSKTRINFQHLIIKSSDSKNEDYSHPSVCSRRLHQSLVVIESSNTVQWDWSCLSFQHALFRETQINGNQLDTEFADEFIHKDLLTLSIENCRIREIHYQTFSEAINLRALRVVGNEISILQRSILPKSLPKLTIMDFSRNRIAYIEAGFFDGIQGLVELNLDSNPLLRFEEQVFKPIWLNLERLIVRGGKFKCIEFCWILEKKMLPHPAFFDLMTCTISPANLAKTSLKKKNEMLSLDSILETGKNSATLIL